MLETLPDHYWQHKPATRGKQGKYTVHGMPTGAAVGYKGRKPFVGNQPMTRRSLFFLLLFVFSACEKPLRLPYIPPELHNWPTPYKGVAGLRLHVFITGKVSLPGQLVYRDSSLLSTQPLDILVFAIEHPRRGLILVGTGLNHNIANNGERYLGALPSSLSTLTMAEGQDILAQLKRAKLPDSRVHHIILPDLRFDHAGELESFSSAQPIVASTEYNAATEQEGDALYLSREYDGIREWRFIDFAGAGPLGTFRAHRDLFGDGSVLLIDAAGATAGGLAVLVRLPTRPVLICGNLAWTREQYFYVRAPGLLFDRAAWWDKAWRLKKFKELAEELIVLPDHEWAIVESVKTKDMILHPFPDKEEKNVGKGKQESEQKEERQRKERQPRAARSKKTDQRKP